MIINRKTKQEIKDYIKSEKLKLRLYKKGEIEIPEKWSISDQRAYIQGLETVLDIITTRERIDF